MHRPKVHSNVRRASKAARARWNRDRGHPQRAWYGVLKAAVQADRIERGELPDLTEEEILAWADLFQARTGEWPTAKSGEIPESARETWLLIEAALELGLRGFAPGGTLPRLFAANRGRYNMSDPSFSIEQIMAWADAHHARTLEWPLSTSGLVRGGGGVSWSGLDKALRMGRGGLPGGSSLFQLLAQERGVRHHTLLTEEEILGWADAHHARTGRWPAANSGPVFDAPEEIWSHLNTALGLGHRGLPGGTSIARLLVERRGSRSSRHLPPLTFSQILGWADSFHARTGQWPAVDSGPIIEAPGETWSAIHFALVYGTRDLPRGWSLSRLFAQERGVHSKAHRPRMTLPEILRWADAHHDRHGKWPTAKSGLIPEAPGETWNCVQRALCSGFRGLRGGSTLPQLLKDRRGVANNQDPVPFAVERILAWADAHHMRTGEWPSLGSGSIPESPGDTWSKVENALIRGRRGLEGGSSLARLLADERGRRHHFRPQTLTIPQILSWAEAFHARNGRWPGQKSGAIPEAPGETWCAADCALRAGRRGLPGGLSLARLLDRERPAKPSRFRSRSDASIGPPVQEAKMN
jgi:hypothetical protein